MPQIAFTTRQSKPSVVADGTSQFARGGRYGDAWMVNALSPHGAVSEGSVWTATNATWGTGIALSSATRTTFLATEAAVLMRNTATAGGVTCYPLALVLSCTAAGTAGVSTQFGLILDANNRFGSGGTQLTATHANSGYTGSAATEIYVGNITAAAAVAPRQIARWTAKTAAAPCLAVGDQIVMLFGTQANGGGASLSGVTTGTAASQIVLAAPPVALGPGGNHSLVLHFWAPSQSAAPSFECMASWVER